MERPLSSCLRINQLISPQQSQEILGRKLRTEPASLRIAENTNQSHGTACLQLLNYIWAMHFCRRAAKVRENETSRGKSFMAKRSRLKEINSNCIHKFETRAERDDLGTARSIYATALHQILNWGVSLTTFGTVSSHSVAQSRCTKIGCTNQV